MLARLSPGRLLFASLILASSIAAGAPDGRTDRFVEIYRRGVARQQSLRTIRARFTETTTSSLLVRPIVAHGTVVAATPARVRMTYTDPEPKIVTVDRQWLTIVWPDRKERQRLDITTTQKRIDRYFGHADLDDLRGMFDITADVDSARPRTDRVDMRPKRKQIRQGLERLELWIDRENDVLVQMRMTFPGGDQKTIELEDVVMNAPVTDDAFQAP